MKNINDLHSLIDLVVNDKCHFCEEQAVDYITQHFGFTKDEVQQVATTTLQVPICKSCIECLDDMVLFYCTICHNSAWRFKNKSKYEGIQWMDECPKCRPDKMTKE